MAQPKTETNRVRFGCFLKPENFTAVKEIRHATKAKSEGCVIDEAIEKLYANLARRGIIKK